MREILTHGAFNIFLFIAGLGGGIMIAIDYSTPAVLKIDNMIVYSVKADGEGYKVELFKWNWVLYTKHTYTVGDTIKLCK